MIDAHALHAALFRQARDQRMRRLEHLLVLDAHAGEVGDLEEAPVIDLVGGDAPEREPIVLSLEEVMQQERIAVELLDVQVFARLRIERKAMIEVAHASVALELDLALLERFAVMPAEHRKQQLAARPVDVEEAREGRSASVLEHVLPPGIVGAEHAHVVGHHVEHQAHAVALHRVDELCELSLGADFRIHAVVVDHVVAVRAPRARFEKRRCVYVAHAQAREIRNERDGVGEAELAMELQAVGCHQRASGLGDGFFLEQAALGHDARELHHTRIRLPALERDRELPPPVRVFVDAAREIRLLDELEHVLGLHHQYLRGRAREKSMRRRRRRIETGALEAFLFALALLALARRVDREAELFAPLEVARVPEAAPGRQIMRAHAHQRFARIRRRLAKITGLVLLEKKRPVGKYAGFVQRRAQRLRHRAEILADHHAAVAPALHGEDAEQIAERIIHVAALLRLGAARHAVEALERHHVIEPQRAAHRHVGAQEIDERAVARGAQRARRVRRQAPVLSAWIELVGRRAARNPGGVGGLVAPHFGAAGVGAEREIDVHADRHAELVRVALHCVELRAREPLQVLMKLDAPRVFPGECLHRGRLRVAIFLRPALPAAAELFAQHLEQCVGAQLLGTPFAEFSELAAPLEAREHRLEGLVFGARHTRVVDNLGLAQLRHFAVLEDAGELDVERVQRVAARRAVGAHAARVQRVHADDAGAELRTELDERAQIAEVADAPVPGGAHAVELHHEAPDAPAALEGLGLVAAPAGNRELLLRTLLFLVEAHRLRERAARLRVDLLFPSPDVEVARRDLV